MSLETDLLDTVKNGMIRANPNDAFRKGNVGDRHHVSERAAPRGSIDL
jgi:hypothetical protein